MRGFPKWVPIVGALALVAALVTMGGLWLSSNNSGATAQEPAANARSVTVVGYGRVAVAPDVVMITVGVNERDVDLATAQTNADTKMKAVTAALKANGIAEKDIQTSGYFINPEYQYDQPGLPISGYVVSHSVTAKVRSTDTAGDIVAASINAGANNIGGIWFSLDNPSTGQQQARELAVADAKAKAEELARLANGTLGTVRTISENVAGGPILPYAGEAYPAANSRDAIAPTFNPGESEVVVTVIVTFDMN